MSRGGSIGRGGSSRSGGFSGGSRSFGGGSWSSSSSSYRGSSGSSGLNWLLAGMVLSNRNSGGSGSNELGNSIHDVPKVKYKKVKDKKATTAWAVILGIMLAITIVFCCLNVFKTTTAVVTSYREYKDYYGGGYTTYYFASYEYEVNGKIYSSESGAGWTNIEDYPIGSTCEIYYYNMDPCEIYEVEYKSEMPTHNGGFIFIAVVLGFALLCISIFGVNKYEVEDETSQTKTKVLPADKRQCDYCDSVINKDENKCPNCGASVNY